MYLCYLLYNNIQRVKDSVVIDASGINQTEKLTFRSPGMLLS